MYHNGNNKSNSKISSFMGMGTAIGLCSAFGVLLGAVFGNLVFWLLGGAALGTVLGAVIETTLKKRKG